MRIIVLHRDELEKKLLTIPEFIDDEKFFITIKNSSEKTWALNIKSPTRILYLTIDDITEETPELKLFSINHANKIKTFIDNINPKKTLYINCGSDVSCSSAIGIIVNEYLNKFLINNTTDYEFFYKINKKILPNEYIKNLLDNTFFQDFK